MDSTEEPLISKNYPPPSIEESQSDPSDSEQNQYLQITYNYNPRPFKDLTFLILFIIFVLSTFGFGIFSVSNRNPNSSNVSSYTYSSNSSSCVKSSFSSGVSDSVSLADQVLYDFSGFRSSSVVKDSIWTLVFTLVFSIPFGYCLLLLLKHYTKQIVYITLPFFVVLPIFFNVYWFVACTVSSSCSDALPLVYRIMVLVFVFLLIGIVVWIFVVNRHRIELTVMIIGVASDALLQNLALFGVLPCLMIGLTVYYVPIVVFLVFAKLNGKIVPHESDGAYDCVWKQASWVPAYFVLAILTMLWSLAAMVEAQTFVISGTVAQWYFAKDEDSIPKRTIRSSLRNAFGPSSGTICLSGLLIWVVRVVRAAVDSAREEETSGICIVFLRCCVSPLLTTIDFLNKFTINFAAITGEAYCSSARMTYELLKRNLLSAVFVETVSTRLLRGIVMVLSGIYAIAVCAVLMAASNLGTDSYFVAAIASVLLLIVLTYIVHVLDDVIDTGYVCYAIDRDRGEVCKQEVHEVYVQLPLSRNQRPSLIPERTVDV